MNALPDIEWPGLLHEQLDCLILHVNREAIHHGAEIALLRDLYCWQPR